jgi:hypothetical protein
MSSQAQKELEIIAEKVETLSERFVSSRTDGLILKSEDEAAFTQLVAEAKSILTQSMGPLNEFGSGISNAVIFNSGGFIGGPSKLAVLKVAGLIRGALNHLQRREGIANTTNGKSVGVYVDVSRLIELRNCANSDFDLTRLIRLCEEINSAYASASAMSCAMLVRAIADHIPPIFSMPNFTEVANNYGGARSFKGAMKTLDNSLRSVADGHLHTQIRKREVVPTMTQVDFRPALDLLLSEVIRLLK